MLRYFICLFLLPFFSLFADKLEAIRPILDLYDRPITILAIGENELVHEIANAYPATCVIAGSKNIKVLGPDQIIHLKKTFALEDLKDLNRREHFDLILAFHSLHELDPWKDSLNVLFSLGDHLIVEVAPETSPAAKENTAIFGIARYLTNLGLTTHLDSPQEDHLMWYCFKPKSVYPHLYSGTKPKGISLATYRKHHGRYPTLEWIKEEKKKLPLWKRMSKTFIRTDGKSLF
ncbi:hypothetical protein [Simkania sp.]|uniref:hypothetical protein n=1 Tax=Simkania sp. TaxID=34094 RepID=UPI003B52CB87